MRQTLPGKKTTGYLPLLLLMIAWAAVQSVLLFKYGIVIKGESQKYMQEAVYWQQHLAFSQPKYLFYSVYIAIQLFAINTGIGNTGVYILQLLLNLYSLYLFYKLAMNLFRDQQAAIIASLLLIACFRWELWTTHLYTESVFSSLVIVFSYFFFKPDKKKRDYLIAMVVFILLLFCRPTGMLFIPVIALFFTGKWLRERKWSLIAITSLCSLSGFILILNYAMRGEGEFDFLKPFIEEHIICGVPQVNTTNLQLPPEGNSIQGLFYYVSHNPLHFSGLAIQKLKAFFGITRPYFSQGHNLYLGLYFYPLYAFALLGLFVRENNNKAFMLFSVSAVAMFALSVTLSCDDWLNRFIMPVLPYIILLATAGITVVIRFIKSSLGKAA